MGKRPMRKLEKFFHDLDQWNRVVVVDTTGAQDRGFQVPETLGPDEASDRRMFIIVSSNTSGTEPKQDAKLA